MHSLRKMLAGLHVRLLQLAALLAILVAAGFLGALGTTRALALVDGSSASSAGPAALLAAAAAVAPAGKAHCRCEISCSGGGKQFSKANDPFPGFTQVSEQERNRCRAECSTWVGNEIQNWASEQGVCGQLTCSGTSHVGDEKRSNYKTVTPITTSRQCGAAGSNGDCCGPGSSNDIASLFNRYSVAGLPGTYDLVFQRSLNIPYHQTLQAYATYVGSPGVRPNLHHMWVNYKLEEETTSGNWTMHGWGAVKVFPDPKDDVSPVQSFILNNIPADFKIKTNTLYRVTRSLWFKDAQDRDIAAFGDPGCKTLGFTFRIEVFPLKQGRLTGLIPMAVVKVEGLPDRTVPIGELTPAERDGLAVPRKDNQ